ncbi:fibronectin type III domain-containing protein, partial [Psychroflexus aestuariivivens]|uniref:fibronectin type III domain-containing protein n=1 Tax=Psychroflexus aestuariivivens TaxID=1795040 RepID=UPI000FDBC836
VCEVPVNLTLNNIEQNSVDLSWDNTSTAVNGFTWYIFAENDDPLVDAPLQTGSTAQGVTDVNITGLSESTTYQAFVEASCANDISDLSEALVFTTANSCETPSNLVISNITLDGADLSWDDTSNSTDGFIWYVFNSGDDPNTSTPVDTGITSSGETNVTIDGLNSNTVYQAYVQSDCNFDTSNLSGAVSFTTLEECDAPTNLSVSNIQQTSVELNWDDDENATVGYVWYVFNQGDDPLTAIAVQSGATISGVNSVTVNGLDAETPYQAYVEASCESGFSDLTNPEDFSTLSINDAPVNDDICDAIVLGLENGTTSDQYTNANATTQTDEASGSCFSSDAESSVWFSFVAPSSEIVEVSFDSGGGIISPKVAVFEAINGCTDLASLVEISCNVDFSMSSEFEISGLSEGTTYYIQVDSEVANVGDFGISVEETLSIRDGFDQFNFSFYPNPVKTHLNMSASANIEKVIIYNMLGQEVQTLLPNNMQSEIYLENLQTGKYLVKVTIDGATEIFSILKE